MFVSCVLFIDRQHKQKLIRNKHFVHAVRSAAHAVYIASYFRLQIRINFHRSEWKCALEFYILSIFFSRAHCAAVSFHLRDECVCERIGAQVIRFN